MDSAVIIIKLKSVFNVNSSINVQYAIDIYRPILSVLH